MVRILRAPTVTTFCCKFKMTFCRLVSNNMGVELQKEHNTLALSQMYCYVYMVNLLPYKQQQVYTCTFTSICLPHATPGIPALLARLDRPNFLDILIAIPPEHYFGKRKLPWLWSRDGPVSASLRPRNWPLQRILELAIYSGLEEPLQHRFFKSRISFTWFDAMIFPWSNVSNLADLLQKNINGKGPGRTQILH